MRAGALSLLGSLTLALVAPPALAATIKVTIDRLV
ncbi:MAG: amicyanin, partial [Mesorhizobium sp.]